MSASATAVTTFNAMITLFWNAVGIGFTPMDRTFLAITHCLKLAKSLERGEGGRREKIRKDGEIERIAKSLYFAIASDPSLREKLKAYIEDQLVRVNALEENSSIARRHFEDDLKAIGYAADALDEADEELTSKLVDKNQMFAIGEYPVAVLLQQSASLLRLVYGLQNKIGEYKRQSHSNSATTDDMDDAPSMSARSSGKKQHGGRSADSRKADQERRLEMKGNSGGGSKKKNRAAA